MMCGNCNGTGVLDSGNGDFPCDCVAGDQVLFNVTGELGPVVGRDLKNRTSPVVPAPGDMLKGALVQSQSEFWESPRAQLALQVAAKQLSPGHPDQQKLAGELMSLSDDELVAKLRPPDYDMRLIRREAHQEIAKVTAKFKWVKPTRDTLIALGTEIQRVLNELVARHDILKGALRFKVGVVKNEKRRELDLKIVPVGSLAKTWTSAALGDQVGPSVNASYSFQGPESYLD